MNNKGFAITTILYGTFLLFMMLLLAMLGILGSYKHNMDILIEENNGARDIVDIYDKDSYLMTISEPLEDRKFYKAYDGTAIIGYIYNGIHTGPLLVSTKADAVAYYTSHYTVTGDAKQIFTYSGTVNYLGTDYYYSSPTYWMTGNITATGPYNWSRIEAKKSDYGDDFLKEAAKKLLDQKVKYYVNN